jgi:hypothetical protein
MSSSTHGVGQRDPYDRDMGDRLPAGHLTHHRVWSIVPALDGSGLSKYPSPFDLYFPVAVRISPLPLALSGLSGAVVGFSISALFFAQRGASAPASRAPMALRPSSEADGQERFAGQGADSRPGPSGSPAGKAGATSDTSEGVEEGARAREMRELRARERTARDQLSAARQRLAQLEKELEEERPARPKRTRREFDFTPDDWREMAAQGVMKYRLPCEGKPPGDDVLDELGLAPDDRAVMRQAFENSATRVRSALLPLCAAALGDRTEVAQEMSTASCRELITSTASDRSESRPESMRRVATFMAGDGPRPDENGTITERMFLVLAEESKHFEDELAEAFGPEDAHRLVFSDRLCFYTATHHYSSPPGNSPPP